MVNRPPTAVPKCGVAKQKKRPVFCSWTGATTWVCPTAACRQRWRPDISWRPCFDRVRPTWLLAPYWIDAHPDHVAATQLIEDARFWAKLTKTDLPGEPHHPARIYYYYCVHLRLTPQPAFVLDISAHWESKSAAIACYRSQFITGRCGRKSYAAGATAGRSGLLGAAHWSSLWRAVCEPRTGWAARTQRSSVGLVAVRA